MQRLHLRHRDPWNEGPDLATNRAFAMNSRSAHAWNSRMRQPETGRNAPSFPRSVQETATCSGEGKEKRRNPLRFSLLEVCPLAEFPRTKSLLGPALPPGPNSAGEWTASAAAQ